LSILAKYSFEGTLPKYSVLLEGAWERGERPAERTVCCICGCVGVFGRGILGGGPFWGGGSKEPCHEEDECIAGGDVPLVLLEAIGGEGGEEEERRAVGVSCYCEELATEETANDKRGNADGIYVRCCIEVGEGGVRMVSLWAKDGGPTRRTGAAAAVRSMLAGELDKGSACKRTLCM
jgi:hypothetical protein